MEHDQEELLEVGSTSRRGRRTAGWILTLAAALTLIALHASTGPAQHAAVPSTTPSEPIGTIPDGRSARPWPTTPGACGADTLLPIVSSAPPAERTGIRVLLGGDRLRLVDFDSGHAMNLPDEVVRPGEYAAVLAGDPVTAYATTRSCNETAHYAMLRISVDHRLRFIRSLDPTESLLTDRNRVWIVSFAADRPYATITPVAGGRPVRLPAGFYPSAIVGDTIVGLLQANPSAPPSWLVLIDAHTGQVRARLERLVSPLAAGAGQVFWTSGCQADDATSCTLRLRAIAGGATTGYPLPHPACCGVVSPDGKRIAFVLERATTDSRFEGHPLPPADIAVMRLDTGRLDIVPSIELPAKSQPGLAFAEPGGWLAIALDAGSRTRLLAWRPGLRQPYETSALPGLVHDSPTLVITGH